MCGREMEYINEAFESNWIAPLGPNVDCFEKEIANYVGVKGAVAVSSGTAAIHLALSLLKVGKRRYCFLLEFNICCHCKSDSLSRGRTGFY